ncbi:WhiB family transcriptional regulator (plasmid) [Streptomyces sp. GDS52]|uniref:WhiB family transcriptional regulator n=1 Tax=Streptomyces sp. GDS52 TaxID=3406419 RepID=UPI003FCFCC5E
MTSSKALRKAWEEHPRYRYRGCAPDVDEPTRAAGDLSLTLDAWSGGEDRDGNEPQKEREARQSAAIDVCFGCPVMVACDAYASSVVVEDGTARLAEPDGIWGGRTALERHRAFIRRRHEMAAPAPARLVMTAQRVAVLRALAVHADPRAVAAASGVDVRTANWQRRRLVTMLALPQEATRVQLLEVAVARGLLEGVSVVADDGSVPAVPPASKAPEPEPAASAVPEPSPVVPKPGRRSRRSRVQVLPGRVSVSPDQLSLDDALAVALAPSPVAPLFTNRPLEAAA